MATSKRQVLIRVVPQDYEKLKAIADKNNRSVSNQLEYLIKKLIAYDESKKNNNTVFNSQIGDENLQVTTF